MHKTLLAGAIPPQLFLFTLHRVPFPSADEKDFPLQLFLLVISFMAETYQALELVRCGDK